MTAVSLHGTNQNQQQIIMRKHEHLITKPKCVSNIISSV
jgi:hypothetical protein